MNKFYWAGILMAAFYGHSRFVFSEPAMMSWMQKQQNLALKGADGMCDAYAQDVKVSLRMQTERGEAAVEGGKEDLCNHLKDASAALRVTQPSLNINNELLSLEPSGFPWMSATVKMRQTSTLQMRGAPLMTEVSDSTYVVKRTFEGRQISSIDGDSTVSLSR
ncbi:hypothetical protein ACVC7V_04395 [Hydrogenophaga sp. A37]|uniref:hypothetical protein n=1 Tax=Hydrogenophaga sp. A37 TaxID=1945864 RepID=UPI000985B995|nr:hypothetical protein [Hydrogenophaga sp. A37]OOG81061.1 hypothetical protein B0E41_18995 [Hydrogenophaga sp. A37]